MSPRAWPGLRPCTLVSITRRGIGRANGTAHLRDVSFARPWGRGAEPARRRGRSITGVNEAKRLMPITPSATSSSETSTAVVSTSARSPPGHVLSHGVRRRNADQPPAISFPRSERRATGARQRPAGSHGLRSCGPRPCSDLSRFLSGRPKPPASPVRTISVAHCSIDTRRHN